MDIISGKFVYRYGKRNAVPHNADLPEVNRIFYCAYRDSGRLG